MKKDTVGLLARMLLVFVAIVAGMTLAQYFDAHDAARAGVPRSST